MNGIIASELKYFDGERSDGGFLCFQTSGQTGTTALSLIRLTSSSLSVNNETVDLLSFDSAFSIASALGPVSWEISAEGYYVGSEATSNPYSGTSSGVINVTGKLTGEQLLDMALERRTDITAFIKNGSKIKRGKVVIASYEVSASVGEHQTYTLSLKGNGKLINA